jgi:Uma2 family endonuclease
LAAKSVMNIQSDAWPKRHRLSVHDYHRMAEVGVLPADARVELIDGEIIDMAPIGERHGATVMLMNRRLIMAVGDLSLLSVQGAVRLNLHTEVQPDFALLRPREDHYRSRHPSPEDVFLLVEVSDSTLRFDLGRKADLYASHAIAELWVIDVNQAVLHRMTAPEEGRYTAKETLSAGVMQIPGVNVPVDLSDAF